MLRLNLKERYKDEFVLNITKQNKIELTTLARNNVKTQSVKTFLKSAGISYKPLKDYNEFLDAVDNLNSEKIPATYICYLDEKLKDVFVFECMASSAVHVKFCFGYHPENEEVLDLVKKLFRFDQMTTAIFESNFKNNYNFLTNFYVLEVLFADIAIKQAGGTPFKIWKKKCKNGKIREIVAPDPQIKEPLSNLNFYLQKAYDKRNSDFQTAYKKGMNVKTGAKLHKNHKYQYSLDLKDFFPSCKRKYVERYLSFIFNYTFNRQFIFNRFLSLILLNDALTIGNPISGTLANVILSKAFTYMNNICKRTGITLSVYADDITFSSDKFLVYDYVEGVFNEAFSKYDLQFDFNLNQKKSHGSSNNRRKVTGVTINHEDKLTVPRAYFKELRAQIHHLSLGDNINLQKLKGKIAYALMIDESGKVLNYLAKYYETVKEYNLCPKSIGKIKKLAK